MACHNRAQLTQKFFDHFLVAQFNAFEFEFIVIDDGSVDDTFEVLVSQPVSIKVIKGSGQLYWAKSMALAEAAIDYLPDAILWVNDDLLLAPTAFEILLRGIHERPNSVLVGQVKDESSAEILYGGYRRKGINPLKLELISLDETYKSADTFNGNFVYIPAEVRMSVGAIDGYYSHAYADCDYGLRTAKAGYKIWILPEPVGVCRKNLIIYPKSRFRKILYINGPKYSPLKSQIRFFSKHTQRRRIYLIPIFLVMPFLKILIFNSLGPKNLKNSSFPKCTLSLKKGI